MPASSGTMVKITVLLAPPARVASLVSSIVPFISRVIWWLPSSSPMLVSRVLILTVSPALASDGEISSDLMVKFACRAFDDVSVVLVDGFLEIVKTGPGDDNTRQ